MRLLLVGACAMLVTGCESWSQRVDASRQDRCQRADWALVGERDGVAGGHQQLFIDRYSYICGDMFELKAYQEGYAKGFARRPKPGA